MTDIPDKKSVTEPEKVNTRRALLKGAVTTLPMVLTLQSGAALARSSNIISATSDLGAKDALGNTQCLDTTFATQIDANTVDLGNAVDLNITLIPERDYKRSPQGSAVNATEGEVCNEAGPFYHQASGWQEVRGQSGMLVSSTALNSFIGRTRFNVTQM
jgi:hypothetical protein